MSPTLGVASMACGMSLRSALRTIRGAITNPASAYKATIAAAMRDPTCDFSPEHLHHRRTRRRHRCGPEDYFYTPELV